jgi:hypothetical protein
MPEKRAQVPWTQPPLFEPDWIVLEFRLNVSADNDVVWGGVYVTDGWSGEALMVTAAPMRDGIIGLRDALDQMFDIAANHLQCGAPFADAPPRSPQD